MIIPIMGPTACSFPLRTSSTASGRAAIAAHGRGQAAEQEEAGEAGARRFGRSEKNGQEAEEEDHEGAKT